MAWAITTIGSSLISNQFKQLNHVQIAKCHCIIEQAQIETRDSDNQDSQTQALGQRPCSSVPDMMLHSRGDLAIIEEQNEMNEHDPEQTNNKI